MFIAAESFRSTARISYEGKGFRPLSLHSSPKPPPVVTTRKRTKGTSGIDASPHTSQARPLAKRFTTGVHGKRLAFPAQGNCKLNRKSKCFISDYYRSTHRVPKIIH